MPFSSSVVLSPPTQCQWDGTTIYVVMWATRDTVSSVEGWELNLHKSIPCTTGIEPGAAVWQAHKLLLPLNSPQSSISVLVALSGAMWCWHGKHGKRLIILADDITACDTNAQTTPDSGFGAKDVTLTSWHSLSEWLQFIWPQTEHDPWFSGPKGTSTAWWPRPL